MTIVLLGGPADPFAPSPRRCRGYQRALAHVRSYELDRALADGADPDSSVLLSLRAGTLLGARMRAQLAGTLRRVIRDAGTRPSRSTVPLAWREILAARDLLEQVATVLDSPGAIDPHGAAQVALLIRSGTSPIYPPTRAGMLSRRLRATLNALDLRSTIHEG
jgi:hypothetical protein